MLGNPRQHLRSDLFTIMECENVIWPAESRKDTMRSAGLPFNYPTNAKKQQGLEGLWLTAIGSC
jgi:hypothetical protein